MDKQPIEIWREHKWAILLAAGGLFFAILAIQYSFIKAIFIFLCIGIGLVIGRYLDKKTDFSKKIGDFFSNDSDE